MRWCGRKIAARGRGCGIEAAACDFPQLLVEQLREIGPSHEDAIGGHGAGLSRVPGAGYRVPGTRYAAPKEMR